MADLLDELEKMRSAITIHGDGEYEFREALDAAWPELLARLRAAEARIAELEAALKGLHDDTAEYQEINRLGGYDDHWMKAARAALAKEKP